MSLLESQRYLLEEVEVLENAMAERVRRNFDLVPKYVKHVQDEAIQTRKRPRKEMIAQQTELKFFKDIYKKKVQRVLDNRSSRRALFQEEIGKLEDKEGTCRQFEKMLVKLRQRHPEGENQAPGSAVDATEPYRMFSVAPEDLKRTKKGKLRANRRHVLSKAGSHIDIDKIFSIPEAYGKSLDLHKFYEDYLRMVKEERSDVSYLSMFERVPYDSSIRRTSDYRIYLKELTEYLFSFLERAHPLEDVGEMKKDIEKSYVQHCKNSEGKPNKKGEIFCTACQRLFSKETVYSSHLLGKKHLKNLAFRKEENGNEANFETNVSKQDSRERPEVDLGFLEFEVQELVQSLNKERESAKADAERSSTLTEREKIIETASAANEDSEFTPVDSDSDEEELNNSSEEDEGISLKNLPLGADGKPIPYWLYKLQGLHKSYNCEICGNMSYRGIQLFYKHFTGQKHQHGLRCLGVSDDYIPLFKNIVRIDEALEYWRYLKKAKRVKENENENAVEVEDNEGNVLPEKDYLELKKQGLL